jgi:hypothetical protein
MSAFGGKRTLAADLELPVGSVSNSAGMKGIGMRLLAGLLALWMSSFANASPPPPPPQIIQNIAEQLLPTPNTTSFGVYSGLFANDLTVTMNGRTVAANKGEWLAIERDRLGKIDDLFMASPRTTTACSSWIASTTTPTSIARLETSAFLTRGGLRELCGTRSVRITSCTTCAFFKRTQ